MKKFLLFCFFALMCVPGHANIAVSPFFIEFDADTDRRSNHIRFTNTGARETTYNIKIVNYRQNSDGTYSPIDVAIDGNPFAAPYLEYSPHQVTLKPMESQVVRIQRRSMAVAPDGEYVSHLLVQEVPPANTDTNSGQNNNGISINLRAIYGVSIPVMVTKGDVSATARIRQVRVDYNDGQYVANVTVERFGTRSFNGTLIVKDDEVEIGRVNNFRIFMTTPERVVNIPLGTKKPQNAWVTLIDGRNDEILETKSI